MKHRNILIPAILLVSLLSLKFQCKAPFEPIPINVKYAFKQKITITPYNLNYKVGDTILLKIFIPNKQLFDEKTNANVFFDSAQFSSQLQYSLLYNNPFIGNISYASFVFSNGVTAYTYNAGFQIFSDITFGCNPSSDYNLTISIILREKGVYGINFINHSIRKCFLNTDLNSTLAFSYDVTDVHKQYYQQLPFANIGKQEDPYVLTALDAKSMVVINVQ